MEQRTKADVIRERGTVVGCCNRHADNMPCDCLAEAADDCPQPAGTAPDETDCSPSFASPEAYRLIAKVRRDIAKFN